MKNIDIKHRILQIIFIVIVFLLCIKIYSYYHVSKPNNRQNISITNDTTKTGVTYDSLFNTIDYGLTKVLLERKESLASIQQLKEKIKISKPVLAYVNSTFEKDLDFVK